MYWEILGLVLVTLYFVLSLLLPKTEEHSNKGQEKSEDVKNEKISSGELEKNRVKGPSQSVDPTVGGDVESCEVVRSSSCYAQAEPEFDIPSSEQKEIVLPNEEALPSKEDALNGLEPTIDTSELNAIESSCDTAKLSELEIIPSTTDQSLFSVNDFGESQKLVLDSQVGEDEKNGQEIYNSVNITEEKVPSKYFYLESKNANESEKGLLEDDVCVEGLSDFTDKTYENNASRKTHSIESADFHAQDSTDQNELRNTNISNEMETASPLQNDEKLVEFADGLACSTIETAVDNSICLSNFAENLSEKIFWDSADDVISEVHASILKQSQDSTVKLKRVKLESLGVTVASEVVNEAIGEAALKKEYMSDEEQDLTSPQRIQPQIGYVVENVVNNAICEAALKLKRDCEDNDNQLEVVSEPDENERLDILTSDKESQDASVLPDKNTLTTESLNKDIPLEEEEYVTQLLSIQSSENTDEAERSIDIQSPTTENTTSDDVILEEEVSAKQLEKHIDKQNIETSKDVTNNISIDIQTSGPVQKESSKPFDRIQDKGSDDSFSQISKDQVSETDIQFSIESTTLPDNEKVTKWADDVPNEPSNKHSESEPVNYLAEKQSSSAAMKSFAEADNQEVLEPEKESLIELTAERETAQVTEIEIDSKKETSEPDIESKAENEFNQIESDTENVKSFKLENNNDDLNNITVCKADSISNSDPTSIPDITLTVDKDSSLSSSELEEDDPSSESSPDQTNTITLRDKGDLNGENKDNFWRRSLILDLEEDFELEDSLSSDATSPESPIPIRDLQSPQSNESEEFIDSEEDEIIDHDADAQLGAVGGSANTAKNLEDDDFDFYDYGSDEEEDEDEDIFEPILTVDGLCVSKQTEKKGKKKKKGNIKSVGSHYNRAVVVDNGCGIIKVGYAGDRVPRVVQQAVSAIPSRFSMQITGLGANLRDFKKFGDFAVAKSGVMHLSHPMKAGMIDNWTDIEDIWEHMIYEELGAEIGDNPIIMTEVAQNPKKNREKITEILFEHFNIPAMFLADQLPLSIYACGLTSGMCLSSGYSCTQAAVVYEGHTLAYTLQHLDIGGGHLTENLKMLLRDVRARNFTSSSGWQIVNDIKEKLAFVALDYESEIHKYKTNDSLTKYYTLPDGQVIDIGYESMSCVEPLFKPDELISADATTASQAPVHEMVNNAIKRCDADLQKMCYNNIILSGGTTNLKGFSSRLQHDLHQLNHRIHKIRLPDHRELSPWIGASILGSLPVFDDQYVTMDEYGDVGAHIVHKKCF